MFTHLDCTRMKKTQSIDTFLQPAVRLHYFSSMKKHWVVFTLVVLAFACAEQSAPEQKQEEEPAPKVTKGEVDRSELALLMRSMQDRLALVSDSIEQGYTVNTKFLQEFKHIQTANPSPNMNIDDFYHGMAETFLNNYEQFESDSTDQRTLFNNAIETCLACHQQKCTGPMKVIRRLKVPME